MHEYLVSLALACFIVSAVAGLAMSERMGASRLEDRTYNVVRLTAGIFVVMTSLVLGLLINSAKDNFQAIDHDVHAFATELILLDRRSGSSAPMRRTSGGTWARTCSARGRVPGRRMDRRWSSTTAGPCALS